MSNTIDFFPFLQYLPNEMTSRGRQLNRDVVDTWGGQVKQVEEKMKGGENVPPCLTKTMLQIRDNEKLSDKEITMTSASFMVGGVETVR